MNSLAKTPRHSGGRTFNYVLLILATILWVASLHATTPVTEIETGIKGQVLMGPTVPGPAVAGESDEAPFRASFQVLDGENKLVTRFKSDENGCFTVLLPPGEYTIIPHKLAPFPYPGRQRKTVTVPQDGFADVTLRFDTGIR